MKQCAGREIVSDVVTAQLNGRTSQPPSGSASDGRPAVTRKLCARRSFGSE
jgi:hypothetical protein